MKMNWKITVQHTAGVTSVAGGGMLEDFACAAGAIALTITKALKDQGEKPAEALESVLNFERDYVRDNLGAEFIGDYMTVDTKLYREMQRELMHKADEELAEGGDPGPENCHGIIKAEQLKEREPELYEALFGEETDTNELDDGDGTATAKEVFDGIVEFIKRKNPAIWERVKQDFKAQGWTLPDDTEDA